ncbi:MAG: 4'-phosphopantetheinyl transferase superfamily protein [Paramuribaculum sp.]|nr:4'-phosphopantetheinyl transferase superfamily protein [Paramuribaculum sp.]MDE7452746.1 4'-phosphopantetheinyl transferase superfamily protein [Paramuribaculum sp.]
MKLFAATPIYNIYIKELSAPGRAGEKATVGQMVKELFYGAELSHAISGAPFVEGIDKHISISHGGGYAVIAVSDKPIGVDIEAPREQLERIRHKFMRSEDCAESLLHAWTAKEAAFKASGNASVTVHDIVVKYNSAYITGNGCKTIDFYNLDSLLIAVAH